MPLQSPMMGPAIKTENSASIMARSLLLDENGDYVGDDLAVFVDTIVGDGDTRAAKKFIAEQEKIIGEIVKDIAECFPDIGHAVKCISGEWYKLADKDKSLKGKNLLESTRIRAMCSDIVKAFKWLLDKLKELDERTDDRVRPLLIECLDRVHNIVPHRCAMHANCEPDICGFVKLKEEHPDRTDELHKEPGPQDIRRHHQTTKSDW